MTEKESAHARAREPRHTRKEKSEGIENLNNTIELVHS